jgi:biotin transport system substrate-specific component
MECKQLIQERDVKRWMHDSLARGVPILLGSFLLAILSQIAIPLPFSPVPITLQTLGVAILVMGLGVKNAPWAVLLYLVQATLGLPVLAGGSANPLWIVGPTAGYLLGFLLSAYATSKIVAWSHPQSFFRAWLALAVNEGVILTMGFAWLAYFAGIQNAFMIGVAPFLFGAGCKITMAAALFRPIVWFKSKF